METIEFAVREEHTARRVAAAALYLNYYALLSNVAMRRYGLPADEAENVIQEVFVSYLRTSSLIRNPKAWLLGAIANGCREYWHYRARDQQGSTDESTAEDFDGRILSSQLLAQLPVSSQTVLRLHYIEGWTAAEIARRLRTSARYAEKLIHRGLTRARGLVRR